MSLGAKLELNVWSKPIIEPAAENLVRNKGSTKITWLHKEVIDIVVIDFSNDVCSTTNMQSSGNRELRVAEFRIRSIDNKAIQSTVEEYFVPIMSTYC